MRPPRLTTRRLMALIAILAILMGVSLEAHRWSRRAADFRALAASHGREEQEYKEWHRINLKNIAEFEQTFERLKRLRDAGGIVADDSLWTTWEKTIATEKAVADSNARMVEYHARMRREYEQAASLPWAPVPVEPRAPIGGSGPLRPP